MFCPEAPFCPVLTESSCPGLYCLLRASWEKCFISCFLHITPASKTIKSIHDAVFITALILVKCSAMATRRGSQQNPAVCLEILQRCVGFLRRIKTLSSDGTLLPSGISSLQVIFSFPPPGSLSSPFTSEGVKLIGLGNCHSPRFRILFKLTSTAWFSERVSREWGFYKQTNKKLPLSRFTKLYIQSLKLPTLMVFI